MQKKGGKIFFSSVDLIQFHESKFASWAERQAIENVGIKQKAEENAHDKILRQHKERHIKNKLKEIAEKKRVRFHQIEPDKDSEIRRKKTQEHMDKGTEIIAGGLIQVGSFIEHPILLEKIANKSKSGPNVYFPKIISSRHRVHPSDIITLCSIAELLGQILECPIATGSVITTDGENHEISIQKYFYYYSSIKEAFLEFHQQKQSQVLPQVGEDHRHWAAFAAEILNENDNLALVANITRRQVKHLNELSIDTMTKLAKASQAKIAKLGSVYVKLKKQAYLQVKTRNDHDVAVEQLDYFEGKPRGLALIPDQSRNDVFFDIEAYPYIGRGLVYLFGCMMGSKGKNPEYKSFWAYDKTQEKKAVTDCVDWLYELCQVDPLAHIYHYGAYDVNTLIRLLGENRSCEQKLETLLLQQKFVNLHTAVTQGLVVGTQAYSLKEIEKAYKFKRVSDLSNADDSVAMFASWLEEKDGEQYSDSKKLAAILSYNKDDCHSTLELADFLRKHRDAKGIAHVPLKTLDFYTEETQRDGRDFEAETLNEPQGGGQQKTIRETNRADARLFSRFLLPRGQTATHELLR